MYLYFFLHVASTGNQRVYTQKNYR